MLKDTERSLLPLSDKTLQTHKSISRPKILLFGVSIGALVGIFSMINLSIPYLSTNTMNLSNIGVYYDASPFSINYFWLYFSNDTIQYFDTSDWDSQLRFKSSDINYCVIGDSTVVDSLWAQI